MYPSGFYRDENGDLNVQGIKMDALTAKYGTPLFIYDTGLMKERYELFLNTVKSVKGNIHYAVKANDSVNIIKFFGKLAIFFLFPLVRFEIVSFYSLNNITNIYLILHNQA